MSLADDAYDRGVIAMGSGDHVTAIASFLAGHQLSPRDTAIANALAEARRSAGTTSHVAREHVAPADIALPWVGVNLFLAFLVATAKRGWLRRVAWGVWAACAVAWVAVSVMQRDLAVARDQVAVHVADDADSVERYRLEAGDELVVEGRLGEWLKVSSAEGKQGYVLADKVLRVRQ